MQIEFPILRMKRLLHRQFEPSDLENIFLVLSHPDVFANLQNIALKLTSGFIETGVSYFPYLV